LPRVRVGMGNIVDEQVEHDTIREAFLKGVIMMYLITCIIIRTNGQGRKGEESTNSIIRAKKKKSGKGE